MIWGGAEEIEKKNSEALHQEKKFRTLMFDPLAFMFNVERYSTKKISPKWLYS